MLALMRFGVVGTEEVILQQSDAFEGQLNQRKLYRVVVIHT